MGDPAARDRIGERLHHRVLADQLGEGLRTVFAGEHAIRRRGRGLLRLLGKIEPEAGRFGVVHRAV